VFMDNMELTGSWLKLAIEEWKLIEQIDISTNRGSAVYHAQQFVEKLCKAIIAALGFEPPKTHAPSWVIDSIISDHKLGIINLNLSKQDIYRLEQISSLAKTLEDERTRPRYGVRHGNIIVSPNEYYSTDAVKLLLQDAVNISELVYEFLVSLGYCRHFLYLCGELDVIRKKRF